MKNIFNPQPHTTDHALYTLLKALKVKVTKSSSNTCVQNHPDYPSLMSIGSCLDEWGVENHAYKINKETYRDDLLFPFIAYLPEKGGRFIVVNAIEEQRVFYNDESARNQVMSEEIFSMRWNGVALHATSTAESGEPNYNQNTFREFLSFLKAPMAIFGFFILMCIVIIGQEIKWQFLALSGLKLAGIGISVLLLIQSLNANNPLIKNLCALNGKNDCNGILKSNAANVTSWLSWSEVGFFYFSVSYFALLLSSFLWPILAWLNLLTLPFPVYSISYQYKKKNWCVLCCAVQALLILEAVVFLSTESLLEISTFSLNSDLVARLSLAVITPILCWSLLKPILTDAEQSKSLRQQLRKFKYNEDLFNQALKSQPQYAVPDDLMPIVLGNPNAKVTITIVSNPFCGPCSNAHKTLEEWIEQNENLKVKVIFAVKNIDSDRPTKTAKHLISLNLKEDSFYLKKAVNQWYNLDNNDYDKWSKNFPIELDANADMIMHRQYEWCEMAEITFTPTVLINGYKLPEPYKLEDIKFFLP